MDISKINGNGLQTFKGIPAAPPSPSGGGEPAPAAQSQAIDPAVLARMASESGKLTEIDLKSTTDALNGIASAMNRGLDFSVHDGTNTLVVKVIDRKTHETIREIPGEEFLDFVGRMHDFLGLLFDQEA